MALPREAQGAGWSLKLEVRPPYSLERTVWALRRRARNAVDRWDGHRWQRVLVVDGAALEVSVTQTSTGPAREAGRGAATLCTLEVAVTGVDASDRPALAGGVASLLRRTLGLDADLTGFYRLAAGDPLLADLAERHRGLRPPRFPSAFEGLVNAVACQQLSLVVGIDLLNRLATYVGPRVGDAHGFPAPEALAEAEPSLLAELGFSGRKSDTLIRVGRAVASGQLHLAELEDADDASALASLCDIPGIGRWSAEYVLLRGLGRTGIFPGDDVGARNSLRRRLGLEAVLDYAGTVALVDRWNPYAGLVYFHLLLEGLDRTGALA